MWIKRDTIWNKKHYQQLIRDRSSDHYLSPRGWGGGEEDFLLRHNEIYLIPPQGFVVFIWSPPHWQSVDWSPIRSPLKKSNKLIFPEFSTTPPQVINNYWCPTEYYAPSYSCIFLVFKHQGYSNFYSYIREEMLFIFKDVYYAVADKFICKCITNETWRRNVPESPFKGIFSKRFFLLL